MVDIARRLVRSRARLFGGADALRAAAPAVLPPRGPPGPVRRTVRPLARLLASDLSVGRMARGRKRNGGHLPFPRRADRPRDCPCLAILDRKSTRLNSSH